MTLEAVQGFILVESKQSEYRIRRDTKGTPRPAPFISDRNWQSRERYFYQGNESITYDGATAAQKVNVTPPPITQSVVNDYLDKLQHKVLQDDAEVKTALEEFKGKFNLRLTLQPQPPSN